MLYVFPLITLFAKKDTVAPEEMCPAGKSITSQDSSKNSPKKEMWALSDPRTMFSGIVKEIVSEAEVPANGKNVRTTGIRRMAESQARRWCKQGWDHLISWWNQHSKERMTWRSSHPLMRVCDVVRLWLDVARSF